MKTAHEHNTSPVCESDSDVFWSVEVPSRPVLER